MAKLAILAALYFAQGLPFGFQATALPLLLRQRGASLSEIGFAGLLSAPWLFKALWAPLVDRYGSARFGRRKSWIVPAQLGMLVCALCAAQVGSVVALAALVLAMNLCAATQDIAVDGLAVAWLAPEQLGPGNAVQVVGYKLGMLAGGGLLVWASARIGHAGMFRTMALLMGLVLLLALIMRERTQRAAPSPELPLRALFQRLGQALLQRSSAALLAVIATYKMGESMADAMWKPLLLDRGFTSAQIGLWVGTIGLTCSLIGSAAGGVWARRNITRTLLMVAVLRALSVAFEWWVSSQARPSQAMVALVTCFEHLAGGALTTVLFALMMKRSQREIGASHFTLLASVETWGKVPLGTLSGVVAERLGYGALFGTATLLSVGFVLLVVAVRDQLNAETRSAAA